MNTRTASSYAALADEDLMELFQGGYEDAFTVIVTRYRDRLHQFMYRYTHDHMDSEDLVQETFFRVFRGRHSYERIARFSTWIYTIAQNLIRSRYKRNSRMPAVSLDGTDAAEEGHSLDLPDSAPDPEQATHEAFLIEALHEALRHIPVEFREALIMRDLQQLTYEEIAEITGVAMGTVKSRINRGRIRLQELMSAHLPEGTYAGV